MRPRIFLHKVVSWSHFLEMQLRFLHQYTGHPDYIDPPKSGPKKGIDIGGIIATVFGGALALTLAIGMMLWVSRWYNHNRTKRSFWQTVDRFSTRLLFCLIPRLHTPWSYIEYLTPLVTNFFIVSLQTWLFIAPDSCHVREEEVLIVPVQIVSDWIDIFSWNWLKLEEEVNAEYSC